MLFLGGCISTSSSAANEKVSEAGKEANDIFVFNSADAGKNDDNTQTCAISTCHHWGPVCGSNPVKLDLCDNVEENGFGCMKFVKCEIKDGECTTNLDRYKECMACVVDCYELSDADTKVKQYCIDQCY